MKSKSNSSELEEQVKKITRVIRADVKADPNLWRFVRVWEDDYVFAIQSLITTTVEAAVKAEAQEQLEYAIFCTAKMNRQDAHQAMLNRLAALETKEGEQE